MTDPLIENLLRPDAYDHPVGDLRLRETPHAWVILTDADAYKIQKPVRRPFDDLGTLGQRRTACEEECRLNRRVAPDIYLGVRPIYGTRERPTFRAAGEPIEYAVHMRRFRREQLLSEALERDRLGPEHIDEVARVVTTFHRRADIAAPGGLFGTPEAVRQTAVANLMALEAAGTPTGTLRRLDAWTEAEAGRLAAWFGTRLEGGRVREVHGDLRLSRMLLVGEWVRLIGRLGCHPHLRWTDVVSDIATAVTDLQMRQRPQFAMRLLNRWLEETGDYQALIGWRWYAVRQALTRARIAARRGHDFERMPLDLIELRTDLPAFGLAQETIAAPPGTLILMHGLSGSGKSHVAERLCERFAGVRLRSDVERKRIFGLWGEPCLPQLTGNRATAEATEAVYRRLAHNVPPVVAAGFNAVVDATCLRVWQRDLFRRVAESRGVPWLLIDVQASLPTLRRRLAERALAPREPSDAGIEVVERQMKDRDPLTENELRRTVHVETDGTAWWPRLERDLGLALSEPR